MWAHACIFPPALCWQSRVGCSCRRRVCTVHLRGGTSPLIPPFTLQLPLLLPATAAVRPPRACGCVPQPSTHLCLSCDCHVPRPVPSAVSTHSLPSLLCDLHVHILTALFVCAQPAQPALPVAAAHQVGEVAAQEPNHPIAGGYHPYSHYAVTRRCVHVMRTPALFYSTCVQGVAGVAVGVTRKRRSLASPPLLPLPK